MLPLSLFFLSANLCVTHGIWTREKCLAHLSQSVATVDPFPSWSDAAPMPLIGSIRIQGHKRLLPGSRTVRKSQRMALRGSVEHLRIMGRAIGICLYQQLVGSSAQPLSRLCCQLYLCSVSSCLVASFARSTLHSCNGGWWRSRNGFQQVHSVEMVYIYLGSIRSSWPEES